MAEGQSTVKDPACKACQGNWPKENHFIADLGLSKADLHDDQYFHGWTVVVFNRHATELFHLAPTERIQLMEEVNLVAKTLGQVYEARKINYELLGNQLPHIHWHIIPRLANDPAPSNQSGARRMSRMTGPHRPAHQIQLIRTTLNLKA